MQRGKPRNRHLDYWVGTPLLNLLASVHRKRLPPARVQHIGVMCSPALGDTLLFSAALQDLRTAFPSARITHVCMRQNLAAAEIIPGADRRVEIRLTHPLEAVQRMRAERFDVLLDFTSWQRLTALYTLLAGARYTAGFQTPGQQRSRGYDRTVPHREVCHEVENFRALLRGCGLEPPIETGHSPAICVATSRDVPFAEEPDIVALHLWASGQRSWLREWAEHRWLELARRLRREDTLFVITGAPSDLPRMQPFVEEMRAAGLRCEAFVSPDGFRTLTNVLRRCRLVVSVNTGVMHLGAIAGARVVAINGPNRNGRWGPVGPRAVGVEAPGEGCGYLHLGFNFDGNPTDCMERTTVDHVYGAAQELMAHTGELELCRA
ncbi:MAG TPA: glycosyltransferase family 9 protein [Acidobacteriaceae bacterium]|jgi:ADP-heptose:LPS heptosyltransferase